MKRHSFVALLWLAGLMALHGCVEEFDAQLPDEDTRRLVVDGYICSNAEGRISITHTMALDDYRTSYYFVAERNAVVSVESEDGPVEATVRNSQATGGFYTVKVGRLDPAKLYWLRVELDGEVFVSQPQHPLDAMPIDSLSYEQDEDNLEVSIMVSAAGESGGQERYYAWWADEYWEVTTPFEAAYRFEPMLGASSPYVFIPPEERTNHGYCQSPDTRRTYGAAADFRDGVIRKKLLYSFGHKDNRLNTHYYARVYQRAISRQELEYIELQQRQSSQMGGIFSPMPNEMPTNMRCQEGTTPVVGFVGFSGEIGHRIISIPRSEVVYKPQRQATDLSFEMTKAYSPYELFAMGFRLHIHTSHTSSDKWAAPWTLDCTDPFWGATLEKPSGWPTEEELRRDGIIE